MRHPLASSYVCARSGRRGASLIELTRGQRVELDADGVREAFGEKEAEGRTVVAGIRRAASRLAAARTGGGDLRAALMRACAAVPGGRVALAMSGGLDSAVLCALLADRLRSGEIVAFTLCPALPGYSEEQETTALVRALGVEVTRVVATEAEFVAAVPEAVRASETPFYNLHPVGRLLLARRARSEGFEVLVTGDGADQIFGGCPGEDYLPIVGALTRAAGVVPWAPYLELDTAAVDGVDPSKQALRRLAVGLGVPEAHAGRSKRPQLAPPMDLSACYDERRVRDVARRLGRASDAGVGWTTLGILARALEQEPPCAA